MVKLIAMWEFVRDWPWAGFANFASIVALFFALKALRDVRELRAYYLGKVRLPELSLVLRGLTSVLSTQISAFAYSGEAIGLTLTRIEVNLHSVEKKTGGRPKDVAKAIRKTIGKYRKSPSREACAKVYEALVGLESEIENFRRDSEWEP